MSTKAPAAARPNLDALPYETHLNVLCAETQGATWERHYATKWVLSDAAGDGLLLYDPDYWRESGRQPHWPTLPNVVRDPAAWGPAMERELHGYDTLATGEGYRLRCFWYTDTLLLHREYGPLAPALGESVALALLEKAGITPPPRE